MSFTQLINEKDRFRINNQTVLEFVTEKRKSSSNILNAFLDINYQDIFGKTSLHYAVQNNCEETLDHLLDYKNDILAKTILKHGKFIKPEYENSELVKFINLKDLEGKTALFYSIPDAKPNKDNHLVYEDSFELLLKGAEIDGLKSSCVQKLITYMLDKHDFKVKSSKEFSPYDAGILGAYAKDDNKFRPVQEKLLLTYPDVFSELCLKDQCRLFSYFFVHGRVKVIDVLVNSLHDNKKIFEIFKSKDNGFYPLDRVNDSVHLSDDERLEIVKYIMKNSDDTLLFGFDKHPTVYAAEHGHLKTLELLLTKAVDSCSFNDCLYYALQCHQMNVVEYLMGNHKEKIKEDGNTVLHSAADSGASVRFIKYLIGRGEDIHSKNDDGKTPVYLALQRNRKLNFIKYIVEKGKADIEIKYNGKTLLYYALEDEKYDVAKYLLLERNANVDSLNEVMKKQVEFLRNPEKFDLNHKDQNGSSRLHLAIRSSYPSSRLRWYWAYLQGLPSDLAWSRFLIQQGANVNIKDSKGRTPLHWAVQREQTETVEMLLQFGAMFDALDNKYQTPHSLSPKPGKNESKIGWLLEVLDILFKSAKLHEDFNIPKLAKGEQLGGWGPYGEALADVWDSDNPVCFILHAQNAKRKSLFHRAAETGDEDAMGTLLKYDYDCLKRKHEKYNKFPDSIKYKDYQSISINLKDADGNTPLHLAAEKGFAAIVSQLLGKKGILIAENNDEKTPATLARDNGQEDVVRLLEPLENLFVAVKTDNSLEEVKRLVRLGANVNAIDKDNKTLLRYAVILDQIDIVKFLLKKRANIDEIFNCANPFEPVKNKCIDLMNSIKEMFNVMQSDSPDEIKDLLIVIRNEFGIKDIRTVINIQDDSGNSILHYAAEANEYEIVCLLLENGPIVNSENKSGEKPYFMSNYPVVRNMLWSLDDMFKNIENIFAKSEGISPKILANVRNDNELTLLHKAAFDGEMNAVKWLVHNGADVNAENYEGHTAIYLAQKVIETEEEDTSTSNSNSRHINVFDFLNDFITNIRKTTYIGGFRSPNLYNL